MIKVCGMREAENIREVEALGIDLMGFIFWPRSSRFVAEPPAYLPTKCKRVGVFVDENLETVRRIADEYALDYIQLHGHESPDYCAQLQGMRLIKAISVSSHDDIAACKTYEGLVDYFLFDTKVTDSTPALDGSGMAAAMPGGTGRQFEWSVLSAYAGDTPFLLSGGIGPNDAPTLRQTFTLGSFPAGKCLGIDLNSRFELSPGLKDVAALRQFFNELNR